MSRSAKIEPTSTTSADIADLKRKSVRGGVITFVSQAASVAIQLASTVILARLLTPKDYGIIAMVAAVTAFAGLLRDLGLSTAAIQKQNLTNAQQSNLFWINLAMGLTLTLSLAAAAPLVAWFYHKPGVLWVTVALSTSFLIGGLVAQSGALLVRNLWFGRQAAANFSGALAGLVVSVLLALNGCRFWSLVWGQLAGAVVTAVLIFMLSPFRPGLPQRETGIKEMLKFGAHITAYDFVNYFARNLDNILIGRFWGDGPLGLYSRAYALLMFPISNLRGPLNAVAFPVMSRLQDEPGAYCAYYRRITSLLALISMPLSAFLFVAAQPVITLALGRQWNGVVPIFEILASVSFVQPVITLWGMVMISRGLAKRYLHLGVINTIFTVIAFIIGLPWGAVGIASGYAIITYVMALPTLIWAFKRTPVRLADFISSVAAPALASMAAVLVSLIAETWLTLNSALAKLFIYGGLFGMIYIAVLSVVPEGRRSLGQIPSLLLQAIGKTDERKNFAACPASAKPAR